MKYHGTETSPPQWGTSSIWPMVQPTDNAYSNKNFKIIATWTFLLTLETQNGHNVLRPCDRSSLGWHLCHSQSLAGNGLYQLRHVPTYRGTVGLQQRSFWGNGHQLSIRCIFPRSIWIHTCVPIGHWNTKPMESVYSTGHYKKLSKAVRYLCTSAPQLYKCYTITVIQAGHTQSTFLSYTLQILHIYYNNYYYYYYYRLILFL
jgi:hypothetical protein